ncbi:glucose 1-dehydrogenase [Geobacter hydrogenophilus]|uniref:Glucose-1-dehydrogenase n=1 Tax=Geobacter hydrogenophilus TaxID=40983 RepID=A0A9W6FWZ4_9BACT|nr:glucose 1-dehydrogenase [Geobacter hydrogenophilus]MBT0895405.1 glucose 1-dehydrogenase [Geobacter hydrogenophilus]GLI36514.1 glucose-1-dehydrogenase [Geobacter hydrogenophilus]
MNDNLSLQGQVALVTGAATGIGRACALALAAAGADVAVNYRDQPELAAKLVDQIVGETRVRSFSVQADVSVEQDVERMYDAITERFGRIDILVSNAGVQADSVFAQMSLEQWSQVIDVNLTGAFLCARGAVREFLRQPSGLSRALGKIIFTSSVHQVIPWTGHANYAASKGGLMLLMKSIAQELAPKKIRVNAVAPGAIKTDINRDAWEDESAAEDLRKLIPYGRIGEPDDIGPAVAWLASDAADYVTGTTLFIDGGMLLYPGFRTGG